MKLFFKESWHKNLIPALSIKEKQEIISYYTVYEKYSAEISKRAAADLKDHPIFEKLIKNIPKEVSGANRKMSVERQKEAIINGNWKPYIKYQIEQGTILAKMGLDYRSFYEVVILVKNYMGPYLLKECKNGKELLSAMNGMNRFIDIGMSVIGEAFVNEKKQIISEDEQKIKKLNEELNIALKKEKELNEMQSRFVSMASHEFRTPLASIQSSLSLIRKYGEMNKLEEQNRHIDKSESVIKNFSDLLNDFLSLSKLEEGKIRNDVVEFNIKSFISEIVSDMLLLTTSSHKIIYSHTGNKTINMDKELLRGILLNLISNAIKYSPDKKKIVIVSETEKTFLKISVKDSGIGISKADQKFLFERFFRAHNVAHIQGTGLGLNIVAKYLELMNGSINVLSEENKGTTFTTRFPQIAP